MSKQLKPGKGEWWTAPAEAPSGRLVMVTGRSDVEAFRSNGKYKVRVEVSWPYECGADGMPADDVSELMEQAQEAMQSVFLEDPVALLTGIYTGDGERTWVFYTLSTNIFGRKFNDALSGLPVLPLTIYCENDADWAEYSEMARTRIDLD